MANAFGRFERVVVHSERGKAQLVEFGLPERKLRVIGHPVFRSEIARADDGRTALCLGLIRPYKGTEDAVETVLGVDGARLLVVGDPRIPLGGLRATAGERAEWRLGYVPDSELRRALSRPRSRSFPTGPRSTCRARSCRCSERASPRSCTTSAGLGEIVGRFHAGAVVPPGDVGAMQAELARLLGDDDALAARAARRRAGARRADLGPVRREHLELYRELA